MEKVNFKNQLLVHLSTVAVPKNSNRSWVNRNSARWVNIRSASTHVGRHGAEQSGAISFDKRIGGALVADCMLLYFVNDFLVYGARSELPCNLFGAYQIELGNIACAGNFFKQQSDVFVPGDLSGYHQHVGAVDDFIGDFLRPLLHGIEHDVLDRLVQCNGRE